MDEATQNREQKYLELKKNIAWACCSDLLNPPIPPLEPFIPSSNDSVEEKLAKKTEYLRRLENRDKERKKREFELIGELDRVIERVRQARYEYSKTGLDYRVIAETQKNIKISCERCHNRDEDLTKVDPKTGDRICLGITGTGCGQVLLDHQIDLGAAKRNFEGEEDKNHNGPSPNRLMSDAWNMSTSLSVSRAGREDPTFKRVLQTAQVLEMDLSNIGSSEHRTREGYKNRQKREAFELIETLSDRFNVHQSVRDRAKEEFARYRDHKEAVQQYPAVVASCVLLAYQEMSAQMDVDVKAKVFQGPRLPEPSVSAVPLVAVAVDPSDPAGSTLSEQPLAQWQVSEAREWLLAVSGGRYDSFAEAVVAQLEELTRSQESGRSSGSSSKYDVSNDPFLGTTTKAGRLKRLAVLHGNNTNTSNKSSVSKTSAGRLLMTLRLSSVRDPSLDPSALKAAEEHFARALARRSSYEIRRREAREAAAKEATRIAQETAAGLGRGKSRRANDPATPAASTPSGSQSAAEVSQAEAKLELRDLFGGPVSITVVKSPPPSTLPASIVPLRSVLYTPTALDSTTHTAVGPASSDTTGPPLKKVKSKPKFTIS